jgi:hypothetical protein
LSSRSRTGPDVIASSIVLPGAKLTRGRDTCAKNAFRVELPMTENGVPDW